MPRKVSEDKPPANQAAESSKQQPSKNVSRRGMGNNDDNEDDDDDGRDDDDDGVSAEKPRMKQATAFSAGSLKNRPSKDVPRPGTGRGNIHTSHLKRKRDADAAGDDDGDDDG